MESGPGWAGRLRSRRRRDEGERREGKRENAGMESHPRWLALRCGDKTTPV